MNRLIALIVIVGFAFNAHAFSEEATNASSLPMMPESPRSGAPNITASQAEQLLAVQRWQMSMSANNGAGMNVSACVERNLRKIDPGNPAWKASDPRWATMSGVIRQDCTAQQDRIKNEVAPALRKAQLDALKQGYLKHLTSAEADTLIQFYKSDAGHRFQSFQMRLAPAIARGMGRLIGDKSEHSPGAPAPDVMKARMDVLQLSTVFSTLIVAAEDERRAGRDGSGAAAIGMMMSATADTQDDALDQLQRQYSADLREFTAFVTSPAEKDELRAFGDAHAMTSQIAGKFAKEFTPELNGDLKRWRDLYHSLPRGETSAPPQ